MNNYKQLEQDDNYHESFGFCQNYHQGSCIEPYGVGGGYTKNVEISLDAEAQDGYTGSGTSPHVSVKSVVW